MILGVFAAASANGQFAGHEVAYIVGLGGTGATAALLYFSIAFGKVTISTLNSYGSFMCIATIISGFRGHVNVTRVQRLVFVLVIVGVIFYARSKMSSDDTVACGTCHRAGSGVRPTHRSFDMTWRELLVGLTPLVGSPVARREDDRILRGRARYLDDIELPRLAHAA